jgi:hypothetical protein
MYPPRDELRKQPQARSFAPSTEFRFYIVLGVAWLVLASLHLMKHRLSRAVVHAEFAVCYFLLALTAKSASLKQRDRGVIVFGTMAVFLVVDFLAGFLPY